MGAAIICAGALIMLGLCEVAKEIKSLTTTLRQQQEGDHV
jgi:hypothetical protein